MLFAFNAKACQRFSTGTIKNVIFQDLHEIKDNLFDTESWKSQENLDACLCTIDDYLGDFGDRLVDMSYLTLVGLCFSKMVKLYVVKMLKKIKTKESSESQKWK